MMIPIGSHHNNQLLKVRLIKVSLTCNDCSRIKLSANYANWRKLHRK